MPRFRVCLKTVVNVVVEVEAPDVRGAVARAEEAVDFSEAFTGRTGEGWEVSWADEHAAALVDQVDEDGRYVSDDCAVYAGPRYEVSPPTGREDWREVSPLQVG